MRLYGDELHRYCTGMLGSEDKADDVLQAVFLAAFRDLEGFAGRSTFKAWLYGIARNRCLHEGRRLRNWRRWFRSDDATTAPWQGPGADEVLTVAQTLQQLRACLAALPARTRELIVLRFHQGLPYEEIASSWRASSGALRVRMNRTLQLLAACLEKKGATL